ncbi:ATP-binding cassette domain-containing protein [Lichenihabitans sp. Uapishka_5]|uniref:ABC transporter ATP-binding protein n=1 Tax=Lichenihabitans sp. Uapishka_5 TaxID=3037302 RepID=UPI0029E7E3DA|nr:oligopeptide/dipeptide ABC transporter ATP-binding protein [Lichenihabitans sp. Uapishka_5]MDX7953132.1 ATP-binding cassette domain-containing protein [Lichenihabitans sp. Uapishka_5]
MNTPAPLLEAKNLSMHFSLGGRFTAGGPQVLRAVDDVSLTVERGETLGLVGESGCGKSTLGRALLRLYEPTSGQVLFEGHDITRLGLRGLRPLRPRMQMVFQDPAASLNPRRRVGELVAEPLKVHRRPDGRRYSGGDIRARLVELMDLVGLEADHLERYPHEFSGGQRQRIGIARALALDPALVVADESVSALDVSVQAQIVNLFMDLQDRLGITYVFIAHDLSVIRQVSRRTAVMYLGAIVETGPTDTIFAEPAHPYTAALIAAVPVPEVDGPPRERIVLRGDVPSPLDPPSGCRFHTRCPKAQARCRTEAPQLRPMPAGQMAACHYPLV